MPSNKPAVCHPDLVRHTSEGLCRNCYHAIHRNNPEVKKYHYEYYRRHKDTKFAEYSKRRRERRRGQDRTIEYLTAKLSLYRMSLDDYKALLKKQNGVCAVCNEVSVGRRLAVDHDHACCPGARSCGRCVRALLCTRCNTVLGYVRDSQELLSKMIDYLKEKSCITSSEELLDYV